MTSYLRSAFPGLINHISHPLSEEKSSVDAVFGVETDHTELCRFSGSNLKNAT